jgi:hypothetical protein
MAKAGKAFLDSLDAELRSKARHKIDSLERRNWTNLPPRSDAGGVTMGELNEKQIKAACDLMSAVMSKSGYQKMVDIMIADDQLISGGRRRQGIGTVDFALVVFGEPSPSKPWGLQIDGHHIGANVAMQGKKYSFSPSFIGTQPEAFKITKKVRPMGGEIDAAYKLIGSLTEEQLSKAVTSQTKGNLRAGPGADGKMPKQRGLACTSMNDEQKALLLSLVQQWVNNLPKTHSEKRMKKIAQEIDKTYFAWQGPTKFGGAFSFEVLGPSLIIEHACQLQGGNPREHMHSMYRDPTNEYGGQLASKAD